MARLLWLAAGASIGMAATTALAEDPRTEPYRLGEVVVTARPIESETGQTVITVTNGDIEAKGARALDQALSTTPGINITPGGGGGVQRLFLRGLPPRHAPLFLNGVPINSAADGQFDPSLIPTENIAEIKVIQGVSSVLYGPGTTGGVIDIVTKRGTDTFHGDMWGEVGSGPSGLQEADLSGPFGPSGNIFVSGSHDGIAGYPTTSGALRTNSDRERSNAFINLTGGTGDWAFGVTGSYVSASQGIPPSLIPTGGNPFAMPQMFERLNDISGGTAQVDAIYRPAGPFSIRFSAYVNQLDTTDDRFDNGNFNSMSNPTVQTFHQLISSTISGGQTQAIYDLGAAGSLAGVLGARHEEQQIGGTIRDVPVVPAGGGAGRSGGGGSGGAGGAGNFAVEALNSDHIDWTYWGAAEYTVSPLPRTHLIAGVGENWFSQDGARAGADNQWMVGLGYDVIEATRVDISASRKVRYPTLQELFDPQKGSPTLKPESAMDYQAQLTWTPRPRVSVFVTGFYNDIAGFIQNDMGASQNANNQPRFSNRDTLVRGAQIAGQAVVTPTLWLRGGYTFTDTLDKATNTEVNFRPRHIFDLEADYTFLEDWEVYASFIYAADQVVSEQGNPHVQEGLPDFAIVNLRLSRYFPAVGLKLYAEIDNLFNTGYIYGPGFPAPGRTFFGGALFRF